MVNDAVKNQSKIDIDLVFVVLYSTPATLTEVILLHHRREPFASPVALPNNYLELAEKTAQEAFSAFSPTILKLLQKLISLRCHRLFSAMTLETEVFWWSEMDLLFQSNSNCLFSLRK